MSSLKTRKKNRKIKRRILKFLNLFKFKSKNLNIFSQIVLIGVILSIISLFFPWFKEGDIGYNSFSLLLGKKGFFILLIDLFIIFILLSNKRKESFKLNTRLFFRDHYVIIFSGILIFVFSLETFFTIMGLQIEKSSLYISGNGLVLSFVSSILIIISGIILAKQKNISLIVNNSKDEEKNSLENSRNMKLPFN